MLASTSNWGPERRHIIAIGLWRLRAGSNEGGATARLEHREGFLRHVAADSIEDGVATGHDLSEILCVVVDDLILSLIHISEPTRLGMISYAVFCLKKKKKK